VNLLSRSVELLPEAHEFACELGIALRASNEFDRGQEVLGAAMEGGETRVQLRARIEFELGRSLVEANSASRLLEVASASIPTLEAENDDRALGRAWLCIAHVRGGFYCEYGAMEDSAARAATYYRRAGWSPSSALDYLGNALYHGPKPVPEAIDQCDQLLRQHDGDRASEANILMWLGGLEAMRTNFAAGRAHVSRARTIYNEFGLTPNAVDACGRAFAKIDLLAELPGEAEEALHDCCAFLRARAQTALLATRAGELAESIYEQGRYEEAKRWTRVARESAGSDDHDAALTWQPVEARILARFGQVEEAERLARELLEMAARTDSLNRQAEVLSALAEILGIAKRPQEAEEAAEKALALYEQKGNLAAMARATRLVPKRAFAE
jgi:tetratricopeptide (TPR) repeat protein